MQYLKEVREKQTKAYRLVREEDKITKEKNKEKNEKVQEIVGKREKIEKDDWVLVYDCLLYTSTLPTKA